MKRFIALICFFVFFLTLPPVYAASLDIHSNSTQLGSNDEYIATANLSLSATEGTTYYLRGVFYKDGSSNYCGQTWNGSAWFAGPYTTNEGWKNFLPITIHNSSWSGELKAKIDSQDSGCQSSGSYKFKIQRFTNSGSGIFDPQAEQTVLITVPTAIPTTVPTVKSTPTATPTKFSTSTSNPTVQQKPLTTKIITSPSPVVSTTSELGSQSAILGSSDSADVEPTEVIKKEQKKARVLGVSNQLPSVMIFIGGACFLVACGILSVRKLKKRHG